MRRREFIALAGGAAAAVCPVALSAQQPAVPVIGYLSSGSPDSDSYRLGGLRRGLSEGGYIEGRNVAIEYRWAANQLDRLPALAADLVQRRVAVIVTPGVFPTRAAKNTTTGIPIVFTVGFDPVQTGLVASLNRPGGNLTGLNLMGGELGTKGLELLHELLPSTTTIGFLVDPRNPIAEAKTAEVRSKAAIIGIEIYALRASTEGEIETAFADLAQRRTGALLVSNEAFFNARPDQMAALATRYAL